MAKSVIRSLRNYCVSIMYRIETRSQSPPSNNYADLAVYRDDGGRFRRVKDIETSEDEKEVDEDGGTPRRDGMEMVGDWNSRGESVPRRSKLSGDASVTELTLPCAFVRKRGLPDSRFLCITHAATYTCARTYTHTRIPLASSPVPPSLRLRTAAHTDPSVFHPRGRLVDLPLSTSAIQSWEQLHAPFGAAPRLSSFPSCSCIKLLCIQLIRKLSLSVRLEGKNSFFVRKIFDSFVVSHRFTLD